MIQQKILKTVRQGDKAPFDDCKVYFDIIDEAEDVLTLRVFGTDDELLQAEQEAIELYEGYVPEETSSLRFWLALEELGLYDDITAFLETAPKNIKIAANAATHFRRSSQLIQQTATLLELSEEQINAVFRKAQSIID